MAYIPGSLVSMTYIPGSFVSMAYITGSLVSMAYIPGLHDNERTKSYIWVIAL